MCAHMCACVLCRSAGAESGQGGTVEEDDGRLAAARLVEQLSQQPLRLVATRRPYRAGPVPYRTALAAAAPPSGNAQQHAQHATSDGSTSRATRRAHRGRQGEQAGAAQPTQHCTDAMQRPREGCSGQRDLRETDRALQ